MVVLWDALYVLQTRQYSEEVWMDRGSVAAFWDGLCNGDSAEGE